MKSLLVLGSTGSIGTQTLDLVQREPSRLRVEALCARTSARALAEQARVFRPRWVGLCDARGAEELRRELPKGTELLCDPQAAAKLAQTCAYDLAVHGIVGAAGLAASARVLERGKRLALANKESLVVAGGMLMDLARNRGGAVLPVDSELCAIHQCLPRAADGTPRAEGVRRVIVTASGGSLRDVPLGEVGRATPEAALRHPNWSMGKRITVGSATLMNKALEILEVHHLFGLSPAQIDVVLHRQSLVHSLVEFVDGSLLAQLGPADMHGPLHYCLHFPERVSAALGGFDLRLFSQLTFEAVDPRRFPALELGRRCLEWGGDSGCVLNAADEVAVEAFLDGRLAFGDIVPLVSEVLEDWKQGRWKAPEGAAGIERVLAVDRAARERVGALLSAGAA
jgi:1-deoxy-D-xylulose-5-phosphate reductoisomerase